jgi:uncharacterized membrane protein
MNPRVKKFIGTIVMIAFLVFYVMIVSAIAPAVLRNANKAIEMAFYVIAGIAWALPLMPLIKWMEKKPE